MNRVIYEQNISKKEILVYEDMMDDSFDEDFSNENYTDDVTPEMIRIYKERTGNKKNVSDKIVLEWFNSGKYYKK